MLIPEDLDLELDQFVERFEVARAENPHLEVSQFMPSQSHPRYATIGCELLRVDMELSAAAGLPISLESYRLRFPAICQIPECLQELTAEAKRVSLKSVSRRGSAAARANDSAISESFPSPGQSICGFRIVTELGRGAFSHVYLATDASLAQRPVVLKFSTQFPGEAQLLSRLQHKNIVPIYSLHQWQQFHIICMPFLGALTLSDLLRVDRNTDSKPLSGQALIDTLMTKASQTWKDGLPSHTNSTPVQAPIDEFDRGLSSQLQSEVRRMSTTELALWIVAELADGLTHAHTRGILHRDIKPANILLSDDGLPMLLDFNLAAESQPQEGVEQIVGGTLRYMAPEQLRAVERQGGSLGPQTDVYSLGVVLYELLFLQPPFPDRIGNTQEVLRQMQTDRLAPPQLRVDWSRGLTPAVISIVSRALAPTQDSRYESASQLRDDLRRQLSALPLEHSPDRSLRERIGKWNKRHPRLSSLTFVSTLSAVLLIATLAAAWIAINRSQSLAAIDWWQQLEHAEATSRNLVACQNAPTTAIDNWLIESDALLDASPTQLEHLPSEHLTAAQNLISRIHFFRSQGQITLADRTSSAERANHLQLAKNELERSQAFTRDESNQEWIAYINTALQSPADATTSNRPPSAAVLQHQLQHATQTVDRNASNPWHWLSVGQLHLALGQLEPAQSDFQLSRQLSKQQPLPAFFLGVVEMKRRNFEAAQQWFSDALLLDPNCAEALVSRAATRVELKNYQLAINDLDQLGESIKFYPRAWFIRERAQSRLGLTEDAKRSLAAGLAITPIDALGWNARGEANLRSTPPNPTQALADFEKAILIDNTLRNPYENAAHVLAEHLNRPEQAIDKLSAIIAVDPLYALAYSSRAVLFARLGKVAAASEDIEAALALERSAIICYQTASALAVMGKKNSDDKSLADQPQQSNSSLKALELLKEALRQDPKLNKLMHRDQDLTILFDSPEFQQLLAAAQKLQ